jgi:hypothetical protein
MAGSKTRKVSWEFILLGDIGRPDPIGPLN